MMGADRTALVVGGTGVVGRAVLERLSGEPGWAAIGLARRSPGAAMRLPFLAADLLDRGALGRQAATLARVTHVFFALRIPAPDPAAEAVVNAAALENLIAELDRAGAALRHVCLVHGTKWYGCHLGGYKTPAEESDPRHPGANFYFSQHDVIRRLQQGRAWTWSTLRPHTVWGYAAGTGNSLVNGVGVYAALVREAGLPLHFPGPAETYRKCSQGITAGLLADAMLWAATNPACAGGDFNITNGDTFRWEDLWPRVAALFEMDCAGPDPAALDHMENCSAELWGQLCERHRLVQGRIEQLVRWGYLRGLFAMTWDDVSSLKKARLYGFDTAVDSQEAFLSELRKLQRIGIIPA